MDATTPRNDLETSFAPFLFLPSTILRASSPKPVTPPCESSGLDRAVHEGRISIAISLGRNRRDPREFASFRTRSEKVYLCCAINPVLSQRSKRAR